MAEEISRDELIRHVKDLNDEILGLRQERDETLWIESCLKDRTRLLNERIKELSCVYEAIALIRGNGAFKEKLERLVRLIPTAWQHPGSAGARAALNGVECRTPDFRETAWSLSATVNSRGRRVGFLQVSYDKNLPFLDEEKALLAFLAECAGLAAEKDTL